MNMIETTEEKSKGEYVYKDPIKSQNLYCYISKLYAAFKTI